MMAFVTVSMLAAFMYELQLTLGKLTNNYTRLIVIKNI